MRIQDCEKRLKSILNTSEDKSSYDEIIEASKDAVEKDKALLTQLTEELHTLRTDFEKYTEQARKGRGEDESPSWYYRAKERLAYVGKVTGILRDLIVLTERMEEVGKDMNSGN
jgi:hypothetical protein